LYFTQAEFDDFNSDAGSTLNLPTGTADASGKANLRISKYQGSSSNTSGLPGTYPGPSALIDPVDGDIIYNAVAGRWEVTFNVVGFSGFVVQTVTFVLPVTWLNVTGILNAQSYPVISWRVHEQQVSHYTVQRSATGSDFEDIADITSKGSGTNQYYCKDSRALNGRTYYRIRQTDINGKEGFSKTLLLRSNAHAMVTVYPNPSKGNCNVNITDGRLLNTTARLLNLQGEELQRITIRQTVTTIAIGGYAKGIYILQLQNGENIKIVKE
jgi:hypothetical protein